MKTSDHLHEDNRALLEATDREFMRRVLLRLALEADVDLGAIGSCAGDWQDAISAGLRRREGDV